MESTRDYHAQLAELRAEETTLRGQGLNSIQLYNVARSQLQNEFIDQLSRARLADYNKRLGRVLDRISLYETKFGSEDKEISEPVTNGRQS